MKVSTKILLVCVALLVLYYGGKWGLWALLPGCSTTKQYPISFEQAETALFGALHLDKEKVVDKSKRADRFLPQAKAEGELLKSMPMKLFAVYLHEYVPGKRLSFTAEHEYNIGANGSESIRFDLTAKKPDATKITVNYDDRWVGMWPPFVYLNLGYGKERNIHRIIWGTSTNAVMPSCSHGVM